MHFRHSGNVAMAFSALNAPGDVWVMIEIDEIRNVIHPEPLDRLFFLVHAAKVDDL
jgi:hypothetical protein